MLRLKSQCKYLRVALAFIASGRNLAPVIRDTYCVETGWSWRGEQVKGLFFSKQEGISRQWDVCFPMELTWCGEEPLKTPPQPFLKW